MRWNSNRLARARRAGRAILSSGTKAFRAYNKLSSRNKKVANSINTSVSNMTFNPSGEDVYPWLPSPNYDKEKYPPLEEAPSKSSNYRPISTRKFRKALTKLKKPETGIDYTRVYKNNEPGLKTILLSQVYAM